MGRYIGPVCRLCRHIGEKLFLKGERCYTPKCPIEKRRGAPGMRTTSRRRLSDYGIRLREKQKLRYTYGILEGQLRRYLETAQRLPGDTGQTLLQLLERRLDNALFRLNFADSRRQARQMVRHRHITVNGRRVDIPSYLVRVGDLIAWKDGHREFVQALMKGEPQRPVPPWLSLDTSTLTGKVVGLPQPADLEMNINTRLIVEFYSR